MEAKLAALEKRVAELEDKILRLLTLTDFDKHPFTYHELEANLTKEQVEAVFDLMDEAQKSLASPKPMDHHDFERRVYEIVPARNGDYHFAEGIVGTLNQSGQYTDVFRQMKKSGMNLRDNSAPIQ